MNMYWRNIAIKGKPRTLISADGRQYKADVAGICQREGVQPLPGPVALVLVAYRPRKVGDLDNLLKPILDALKGMAFVDDSQVIEIHATRRDDKHNPRAMVQVWRIQDNSDTADVVEAKLRMVSGARPLTEEG